MTATLGIASAAETDSGGLFDGRATGSDISMNPNGPNYIGKFLPQLAETVARFPEIDPDLGVHVN
ncbi:MAG: hypothetical protein R3284_12925, partial [Rubricoccaceae bacterium]|nr:hypothetical protein [Rubricoccaceae bacterium]